MNRLLDFNPEPFEREFEFGAVLGGRDFDSGTVAKPCGCRHAAAAGKLSAFEMDREFGPLSPAIPRTPSPQSPFDSQAFRRRAVQIANQELVRWGDGRIRETDPRLRKTLQDYWKTGVGRSVGEQQLGDRAFQNANPWSAAFISWLMKRAGAGNAFEYSGYHSTYTRAAIDNRLANNSNPFKAYRITEIAPQVGDLVCTSRAGSGATYDNVRPQMKTHCDIVTKVQPGRIAIVGGNVSDSVKQRPLKTDAGGRIAVPGYFAVIGVDGGQPPVPVAPAPTSRLRGRDSIPPGATLYVEIDLKITDRAGIVAPPVTGVFIPEGYQPAAAVDLVLYLHGFKADAIKRDAIGQYWNSQRFPYGAFREGVNASGRNVVLVAPTLGSHSEAGNLVKPGGLDAFLSEVLAALRAYGPQSSAGVAPTLGNLIFACHSGGGWPMRLLAGGQDRVLGQLRECWGFDCTYNRGDDAFWAGWARARPNARVYIYYIPGSPTARLAESLRDKGVPNAIVQPSRIGRHNYVPITHWKERLQAAPFLAARSGGELEFELGDGPDILARPPADARPRSGPRVVLIPGVLGSAIADRSLAPAQARAICEKNVGRKISPSGPFYPCSRQPELLWGGIGSLHWLFDPTAWGQRMTSGNGLNNGGNVAPVGLFEIDIKLRSTRIEMKPYASLITALRQAGADVLVFPYDWRLSNTHNAALLAREILRTWFGGAPPKVSPPREQRITFIGHSMGGLLARYLLETQPLWAGLVRRLITIGTPHRGAPQTFMHFIGRTFPFPRAPYYGWVDALVPKLAAAPGSAGAQLLPAKVQTAVFKFMASAAELMPVYDFVQGESGPEAYRDTYKGQIHPPTGKQVLDVIDNMRRPMINELQLEAWLRTRMLHYHCLAATGTETVSGYHRGRDRVLTTRDGDGSVPRSSALPVPTASSHLHLKTLAAGGHAHPRLCERKDVQAYILGALRDVAQGAAPHTAYAAKPLGALGEQLIQPDDFLAMARSILSGKPPGVGDVLCITRLMAGDGRGPLINAETERVGTKLMLKNPPRHIAGREVFSVESPRHGSFQYIWISSTKSTVSRGGMLFLPKEPRPHELHHAYLVTFNPERLDKRFADACTNAHHAEMQLVGWVEKQPWDWRVRLGTVLISNRSRKKNIGYSPCAHCCDDLAKFLAALKDLQRRTDRTFEVEAGMSWLTLYTYAGICQSHPTTKASLGLMHSRGWKLGGPGWKEPEPAPQPIRRPARPSPVPAHAP